MHDTQMTGLNYGQNISLFLPNFYRGKNTSFALLRAVVSPNEATDQKSKTFLDNYKVWPIMPSTHCKAQSFQLQDPQGKYGSAPKWSI